MSSWKIIIPLLNHQITTFRGPVWHLGAGVYCRTIADEDFGALWRYFGDDGEQYKSLVGPGTKCVYIDGTAFKREVASEELVDLARSQAVLVQSVLNLLSTGNPVVLSFAAILSVGRRTNVADIVDLEPVAEMHIVKAQRYRMGRSATQELAYETYRIVSEVVDRNPHVFVTLSRYNSSLTRASDDDRIIDITISLESLIRERHEIRFKFAIYLSFVVERSPEDRMKAVRALTALYDARSGLVHGTPGDRNVQRAREDVLGNWNYISEVAKSAIIYYLLYLSSEPERGVPWTEHLKRLVVGVDTPIVDEA